MRNKDKAEKISHAIGVMATTGTNCLEYDAARDYLMSLAEEPPPVAPAIVRALRWHVADAVYSATVARSLRERLASYRAAFAYVVAIRAVLRITGVPYRDIPPGVGGLPGQGELRPEQIKAAREWIGPLESNVVFGEE